MQDLLHDVFQSEDADNLHLIQCHTVSAQVGPYLPHDADMRAASLEGVENVCKNRRFGERLNPAVEDGDEVTDLNFILGVNEHQVLRDEQTAEVILVLAINWDAAVALFEDFKDQVVAQPGFNGKHVGVLNLRHEILDLLVTEVQRPPHDLFSHSTGHRIRCAHGNLKPQHFHQFLTTVHRADLLAQHQIKDHADRLCKHIEYNHQQFDDRHSAGADLQGVPGADSLRQNLAEEDDQRSGRKKTNNSIGEIRHENRQGRIHGDVAQQQRAEQLVSLFTERLDLRRALCQLLIVAFLDNLEADEIEAHKAKRESREKARQHDEETNDGQSYPHREPHALGFVLFVDRALTIVFGHLGVERGCRARRISFKTPWLQRYLRRQKR
mmetsp:Transcript_40280/g.110861  ORF Transcript_40280/g.110861 Transcript_40280/m.110861 type:complete len:382 (-) Transcript_40280:271-1416(-)